MTTHRNANAGASEEDELRGHTKEDAEAVRASGLFDEKWYLERYPDVKLLGMDPVEHYLRLGALLNRSPSAKFNPANYLGQNEYAAADGVNPLLHYVRTLQSKPDGEEEAQTAAGEGVRPHYKRGPSSNDIWSGRIDLLATYWKSSPQPSKDVSDDLIAAARAIVETAAPTISVIMPAWNRAHVVCKAIRSVLRQSYQPIEIIISDDGSSDDTAGIVARTFDAEIRSGLIQLLRNRHKGVSAARNAGLKAATGQLFAYLDTDNEWNPHYLLVMAAIFIQCDEVMTAYAALQWHDQDSAKTETRASLFDRRQLIHQNFIDLNIFMHRRELYDQLGGFDESLSRLVDWDLIVRYTTNYVPAFLPYIGVEYYLNKQTLKNISRSVPLDVNRQKVLQRNIVERLQEGLEPLRIAYFIYDYPALSQTFVLSEIRWLVERGYDVKVYYSVDPDKKAELDFNVESYRVADDRELAGLFLTHKRNICHTHFAYPGATHFVWPACSRSGVRFTMMPHAVDIFLRENKHKNRIGEVAASAECLKIFVHGDYHRSFLLAQGVPESKIAYNLQAVSLDALREPHPRSERSQTRRGIFVGRLLEKKGVRYLIEAARMLRDLDIQFDIYGYGPSEAELRALVKARRLTNVTFHGAVEGARNVAEAYRRADFLVVPSVEAANGDLDGFPTVIIEAMAAEVPVIATTVAAIPDYLRDGIDSILVPPRDAKSLSDGIRRLLTMPKRRRRALVARAKAFADTVDVDKTMERLLDTWFGYSVDIVLVTYNTEKYENRKETFEILRRVISRTTTRCTLTIVDNSSDEDFWQEIKALIAGCANVRLVRKRTNELCGPACNIAIGMGRSEFVIYVCSKEGFIKDHGWERTLIEYMRANPDVAMAGHRTHLPSFTYGNELVRHPRFQDFRNQEFAGANPARVFTHVQGGIFIARRDALASVGGFNPKTPQDFMDVELSYCLESHGYRLGGIPSIASITTKTLPRLFSILDERTVAAHPLTIDNVHTQLDSLKRIETRHCNLCGWSNGAFLAGPNQLCPECGSTPFGRLIYRLLANDYRAHKNGSLALVSTDEALAKALSQRMYQLGIFERDGPRFKAALDRSAGSVDCMVVDRALLTAIDQDSFWMVVTKSLSPGGQLLVTDDFGDETECVPKFAQDGSLYHIDVLDFASRSSGYDWRRVVRIERLREISQKDFQKAA